MNSYEDILSVSRDSLEGKVMDLESRVARLESELAFVRSGRVNAQDRGDETHTELPGIGFSGASLESTFGEFGLAWLGNIVLLFGIIFFEQYLQRSGYLMIAALFGYISVAGLFMIGYFLRASHPNMASIFRLNTYILLFIVTMMLHFMVVKPLVTSAAIETALLLAVTVLIYIVAIRKRSQGLTALAVLMAATTALMSDQTHIMLPLAVLMSLGSVLLLRAFGWWRLHIFTIIMVYSISLIWFLGNPVAGHPLAVLKTHQMGYLYVFLVAAINSMVALLPLKDKIPDNSLLSSIVVNGIGFSSMLTFFVLAFFKDDYVMLFASIALFCLVYSILLQSRSSWKVIASLYALYSFVALSVMVFGIYGFPRAYYLLAIQSLLVVSMALWFRSRVIVIMNAAMFIILLIAYLASAELINSANISFALVSLVSARVVNWKKERLNIKTEMLRNSYLITGFFMVLFALFKMMPDHYVTLSWSIAAVAFFVLSLLLKNIKYRYLALATMAATAIYLFLIDLARVEIAYRVIAFLVLAVISIIVSLYYTRRRSKKSEAGITEPGID